MHGLLPSRQKELHSSEYGKPIFLKFVRNSERSDHSKLSD